MAQPVVYLDTSAVKPGRLEELRSKMEELADFVEANEPQLISYTVYFSDDGARMSVMHINPDSASLQFHMQVAGPRFAPIGEYINLIAIDVYGPVDESVVQALQRKAELLGEGTVRLHENVAGFDRLGSSPRT